MLLTDSCARVTRVCSPFPAISNPNRMTDSSRAHGKDRRLNAINSTQGEDVAEPTAKTPLPQGLVVWCWFNVPSLVAHVAVWWMVHPPFGYQLKTDAQGGGPGDGLVVLFYVLFLFFPALLMNTATLLAIIVNRAKLRLREAWALSKLLIAWIVVGLLEVLI